MSFGRFALALALASLATGAQAEPPALGRSPLAALLPTSDEHRSLREQELARRIVPQLARLSGVHEAQLTLALPDGAREPLDRPLAPAKASVLLTLDGAAPSEDVIRALVQSAAHELAGASVTVTHMRVPPVPARAEPLVSVGPFRVSEQSAPALRAVLAVSLLANVTLATFLLVRLRRRSRAHGAY